MTTKPFHYMSTAPSPVRGMIVVHADRKACDRATERARVGSLSSRTRVRIDVDKVHPTNPLCWCTDGVVVAKSIRDAVSESVFRSQVTFVPTRVTTPDYSGPELFLMVCNHVVECHGRRTTFGPGYIRLFFLSRKKIPQELDILEPKFMRGVTLVSKAMRSLLVSHGVRPGRFFPPSVLSSL